MHKKTGQPARAVPYRQSSLVRGKSARGHSFPTRAEAMGAAGGGGPPPVAAPPLGVLGNTHAGHRRGEAAGGSCVGFVAEHALSGPFLFYGDHRRRTKTICAIPRRARTFLKIKKPDGAGRPVFRDFSLQLLAILQASASCSWRRRQGGHRSKPCPCPSRLPRSAPDGTWPRP